MLFNNDCASHGIRSIWIYILNIQVVMFRGTTCKHLLLIFDFSAASPPLAPQLSTSRAEIHVMYLEGCGVEDVET